MTTIFARVGDETLSFSTQATLDEVSNEGGLHFRKGTGFFRHDREMADLIVAIDSRTGEARVVKNRYGPQWSDNKKGQPCPR